MKKRLEAEHFPDAGLLVTCSSHEERCMGVPRLISDWAPSRVFVFHYAEPNERRESNHAELLRLYGAKSEVSEINFDESNPVASFQASSDHLAVLRSELEEAGVPLVMDISVLTKRHLLMLLRWFDDAGLWDHLSLLYIEPEEYDIGEFLPLSFGVRKFEEIPGFSATPDPSRPLHAAIFLGFEGDRALATYELIEPVQTTLFVSDPPSQEKWRGLAEQFNKDLISLVGDDRVESVDALDPSDTQRALVEVLGPEGERSGSSRMLCPLGTKPQAVGCYLYVRNAIDSPAVMYTGPMRHNHQFFSHGIGEASIIKEGRGIANPEQA